MARYCYAVLDENKKVVAVSDLKAAVSRANMVKVAAYDLDLIGRVYDPGAKAFGRKVPEIIEKSIDETMLELLQKIAAKLGV